MATQADMVDTIHHYGVRNKLVLKAISGVDRADFISDDYKGDAYVDEPYPLVLPKQRLSPTP